jgi:hypothetical protein
MRSLQAHTALPVLAAARHRRPYQKAEELTLCLRTFVNRFFHTYFVSRTSLPEQWLLQSFLETLGGLRDMQSYVQYASSSSDPSTHILLPVRRSRRETRERKLA